MEYLRNFPDESAYLAAKAGSGFLLPSVSLIDNPFSIFYDPLFIFNPKYLYEDLSTSKELDSSKRVIGVEVIPGSHMADRKTRFVSVRNMSRTNPETGSVAVGNSDVNDAAMIPWGNYNDPINGMTEYEYSGYQLKQDESAITEENPFGVLNELSSEATQSGLYLATDYDNGIAGNEYPFFDGVYFPGFVTPSGSYSYVSAPYPFNSDGKKNLLYQNNGEGMAITDLNGKTNTATLISRITEPDWNTGVLKTDVGNQEESGRSFNHPAAAACYRFNAGISSLSGQWYLPSMGELGYLWANINKINAKINALGTGMGVAVGDPATAYGEDSSTTGLGGWLWSSSVDSSSDAWYLSTYNGNMNNGSRYNSGDDNRVRAFLSLAV